jgi:hypothetical protein
MQSIYKPLFYESSFVVRHTYKQAVKHNLFRAMGIMGDLMSEDDYIEQLETVLAGEKDILTEAERLALLENDPIRLVYEVGKRIP